MPFIEFEYAYNNIVTNGYGLAIEFTLTLGTKEPRTHSALQNLKST